MSFFTTKPLLMAQSGLAIPISLKAWSALLSGKLPLPAYRKTTIKAMQVMLRTRNTITAIQMLHPVTINFNTDGIPLGWNMNFIPLEQECPLIAHARIHPKRTKFHSEKNFWFPDSDELIQIHAILLRTVTQSKIPNRPPLRHSIPAWRPASSLRAEL